MKIAIIGSGISVLTAAHYLSRCVEHVDLFEAKNYFGGHTNTVDVTNSQEDLLPVDTGFIVFNDLNYPCFNRLLERLEVPFYDTDMSFSYFDPQENFMYSSDIPSGMFAQKKNLFLH